MRAVLQRVTRARVSVGEETVGEIDRPGLVALIGATHDDGREQVDLVVRKIADLRIMRDERSVAELDAPVLVVSQFTLYADARSRRPGFTAAARPDTAIPLYERVVALCREAGFRNVVVHPVPGYDWFKVLVATK